jgi:hypothetical protein
MHYIFESYKRKRMVLFVRTGVIWLISHHTTVLVAMQLPVPFSLQFKSLKKEGCVE